MSETVKEVKEVVQTTGEQAKEVVQASGDVVDKVFSHVDTYFAKVAEALTSDAAKEIGSKVVDTGLTVVQIDAVISVASYLFAVGGFVAVAYIFFRILFDRVKVMGETEVQKAKERINELREIGYGRRTGEEDRELRTLTSSVASYSDGTVRTFWNSWTISDHDGRQVIGGVGLVVASVVGTITAFAGFAPWKVVAIFYPELYLVHLAIEKVL